MKERNKGRKRAAGGSTPQAAVTVLRREAAEPPERHVQSPTAIAAEALSKGVPPASVALRDQPEVPREDELLRVGDDEVDPLSNAYVGDETPGGDMPTPDQDLVDDIGRVYGVAEADSGALRSTSELLDERDRRRAELEAPLPPHGTRGSDRDRGR
jgi:hypothetical protein